MDFGLLESLANGGFALPPPEAIFYMIVVTLYALAGRPLSCLINTFAFAFYWGFIFLMSKAVEIGVRERALMTYVICGIGIFVLVNIASLREKQKKAKMF